jgi:hypothetical protein
MTALLAWPRHDSPIRVLIPNAPSTQSTAPGSFADVVDGMVNSFHGLLAPVVVVATVRRCRRELDILAGPPTLHLVERLARQRLTAMATVTCPLPQRHTGFCSNAPAEAMQDSNPSEQSQRSSHRADQESAQCLSGGARHGGAHAPGSTSIAHPVADPLSQSW